PQAGSDVMGMRTRATPDGSGGWILNGTKCWMSGVVQADWYCVFAKTADDVGSTDRKMGVRGVDTGELLLHDAHVPADNVVGGVGGFRLAMLGLNSMR